MIETTVDERERRVLDRALRELGYEPGDFDVRISPMATDPRERSLPGGTYPRRKEVVATRISTGDSFRQEAYLDGAWAGEILQALMSGRLGPQA